MATGSGSRRPLVIALLMAFLSALMLVDQLLLAPIVLIFDNGDLATGTIAESGTVAPAGTQWSELAGQSGTMAANTTACFVW